MNINQIFIIIQIGLIPSLISLFKFLAKERKYTLFYIYIIISYLIEIITNRLIYYRHISSANITAKLYMLFEFIILIALLKKISRSNNYIKTIKIAGVVIWLIENTFLVKIFESNHSLEAIREICLRMKCGKLDMEKVRAFQTNVIVVFIDQSNGWT